MTFRNPLIDAWHSGRQLVGGWCTLPDALAAEVSARQGVDYICIDQQHGMIDHSTTIPLLQALTAAGTSPLVRVRWNEPAAIMSALDAGALGVIIPLVDTAQDAERAVRSCRFPPHGQRSYGPARASVVHGTRDPEELSRVACLVMVETALALENVKEIAATPGLDGIYIGPSDLCLALGAGLNLTDHRLTTAINRVRTACRDAGIAVGIHATSGEVARGHLEAGFDFVTTYSDAALLAWAVRHHLAVARSTDG